MPRLRKLQEIKTIRLEIAGLEAVIYYDPNEGKNDHLITVGPETHRNKDIDEVERWGYRQMQLIAQYHWVPVIHVIRDLPVSYRTNTGMGFSGLRRKERIGLEVERYYVTRLPDGNYLTIPWDTSADDRHTARGASRFYWHEDTKGIFTPPCNGDENSGFTHSQDHYLPYVESTWLALEAMVTTLQNAAAQLQYLLGTPEGAAMIESYSAGLFLLPEAVASSEHPEEHDHGVVTLSSDVPNDIFLNHRIDLKGEE